MAAAFACIFQHGQHIVGFANALVVGTFCLSHGTKVGAECSVAKIDKGSCQRVGDLVGGGTTADRMRVTDQCNTPRCAGVIDQNLDFANGAIDQDFFFTGKRHGMSFGVGQTRKRSTAMPLTR